MAGVLLILLTALVFPGIILRTRSLLSGRKGPGLFQPLLDWWVLARKGRVVSTTTSLIFQVAPVIQLAAVLVAILVIPVANQPALFPFEGDFVFFAYILAVGRFFMILAALDTGSSFEGMGANREALFSLLVEPALFILLGTFAMLTGYTSFTEIFASFRLDGSPYAFIFGLIGCYLLVQIAMVETSRMPVDDPKTHLELTMIHEVMILDYSGFDKALIHLATAIKFTVYGSLIVSSLVPPKAATVWQVLFFILIQIGFALIIGFSESFRARNKMFRNAQYILTLSAIALLAFVVVLIITHKLIT